MTLLDVEELTRYWIAHPPLHLIVGAYLGAGKQSDKGVPSQRSQRGTFAQSRDPEQLLAELGSGFASGDVHAGLGSVVLDFAELKRKAGTGD